MEQIADRKAMLKRRKVLLALHPEIKYARDLGPLMGEYEREYWQWSIESLEREVTQLRGPKYTEIRRGDGCR